MSVPPFRRAELVETLRVGPGDLVVLRAPEADVAAEKLSAQAEWLAGRTGRPVLVLAEGYDVLAADPDLLLEAIARSRGVRFVEVAEGAIPDGPPAPRTVWVESLSRSDDGWGADLVVVRDEPTPGPSGIVVPGIVVPTLRRAAPPPESEGGGER